MFDSTRRWLRRNRTGLAIAAAAVGATYLAGQYAIGKWLEARQRMAEERISKENIRRRFTQNQQDCTFTVLALMPTVRDEIMTALPVEQISDELQAQRAERLARSSIGASEAASTEFPSNAPSSTDDDRASLSSLPTGSYLHTSQLTDGTSEATKPRRTKVQLWYDMKIQCAFDDSNKKHMRLTLLAITRAFTLIYTLSLLTLLTRIQLNLLGRRAYLSSVVSLASLPTGNRDSVISIENNDDDGRENAYGNDFETNRKYLTFSWWLLHRGSRQVMERVQAAVKEVFGSVSPREDMTLESLSKLILDVRKRVEGSTVSERKSQDWLSVLLPPQSQEQAVLRESGIASLKSDNAEKEYTISASLRRLVDESSDLIESPTFTHVLTLLLNAAFSRLVDDKISSEAFGLPPSIAPLAKISEISDNKCKLANTLAVFCKQAHLIAAGGDAADALDGLSDGAPNEYLAVLDQVNELEAFAAVIYSSNFDQESVEQADDMDETMMSTGATSKMTRADRANDYATAQTLFSQSGLGESAVNVDLDATTESLQKVWNDALSKDGLT